MDFSRVELSDEDQTFLHQVRDFLGSQVTEDVIRHDRETGDNFHEGVHLALGARGFLEKEWKPTADGGFSRVRRRIWELEKRRAAYAAIPLHVNTANCTPEQVAERIIRLWQTEST